MKLIITITKDKYCYIRELEQGNTDYATTQMLYHAVKHGKPYIVQEPCEDCISRRAVLDLIEHYNSDGLGAVFYGYEEGVKFANAIKNLPSVTPQEPKTGHWIYTLEDWNKWECSECGFTKRTDVHVDLGYKYCPNCGAKMEG